VDHMLSKPAVLNIKLGENLLGLAQQLHDTEDGNFTVRLHSI